jgi:hypothetical protein
MNVTDSRARRRAYVALNYLSLAALLVCYHALPDLRSAPMLWIVVGLVLLAAIIASFIAAHVRTGLWRLTHSKADELDERQIHVSHVALRHSYQFFLPLCLLILLAQAVAGRRGIVLFDAILPVALLYVAHTLPSSLLAWTEKEV